MMKATGDTTKRKRPDAPGTPIMVRLQPADLELLDLWRAANSDVSRPEAIRQIIKLVAMRVPD